MNDALFIDKNIAIFIISICTTFICILNYLVFYMLGGSCNRFTLGSRGDNFAALRRASLPQETTLGNLLGNVVTLTSKPISNK